jgi:hypothetical protein
MSEVAEDEAVWTAPDACLADHLIEDDEFPASVATVSLHHIEIPAREGRVNVLLKKLS